MDMDIETLLVVSTGDACVPNVLHEGSLVLAAQRIHVPGGPGTIALSSGAKIDKTPVTKRPARVLSS